MNFQEPVRYLTDDADIDRHRNELRIFMGGNGDWYVSIAPEGEGDIGRGVRIVTSGSRVPGLAVAIANAYRAIHAATNSAPAEDDAKHLGCESTNICPYPEDHPVHHGGRTSVLLAHPFRNRFPIQGCAGARLGREPKHVGHVAGSVPWWLGLAAWERYAEKNGRDQSVERIAERGGFSQCEMDLFLNTGRNWREHFVQTTTARATA